MVRTKRKVMEGTADATVSGSTRGSESVVAADEAKRARNRTCDCLRCFNTSVPGSVLCQYCRSINCMPGTCPCDGCTIDIEWLYGEAWELGEELPNNPFQCLTASGLEELWRQNMGTISKR